MNKKSLVILFLLTTGCGALCAFISDFRGWHDLVQQSPDIVIAKCTSTYGMKHTARPLLLIDGVIPSDVEVLSSLKGNTKPGPAKLQSLYWPYPGQKFAVFGWYVDSQYSAVEGFRIVPLSRDFRVETLNGKTLNEQVQIILSNRLDDVEKEINQDNEEKARIETYLKGK